MQYLFHFSGLKSSKNLVLQKWTGIQIQAPFHHLIWGIYLSDPGPVTPYFLHVYVLGHLVCYE